NAPSRTVFYDLSLHDALPIYDNCKGAGCDLVSIRLTKAGLCDLPVSSCLGQVSHRQSSQENHKSEDDDECYAALLRLKPAHTTARGDRNSGRKRESILPLRGELWILPWS